MAGTTYGAILSAIQSEKSEIEKQKNFLTSFKANIFNQLGVIKNFISSLKNSVKSVLGQFSGGSGYSDAALQSRAEAFVTASLSNQAGATAIIDAGLSPSEEETLGDVQEIINRFYASLNFDASNIFVLPRFIFDNLTNINIRRAELLNEIAEAVAMIKLHHDAIPADFYDADGLEALVNAKPLLEEINRKLVLACNGIAVGEDSEVLVRNSENDLEAIIRALAREVDYDSTGFSHTEYLSYIERLRAAIAELAGIEAEVETTHDNIENFQTNFLASYTSRFSECGTLKSAEDTIETAISRITSLEDKELEPSQVIAETKETVLDLATALAMIQEYVRQKNKFEDVLNNVVSEERTLFEQAQTDLAALPPFSESLLEDLTSFADLAERRLFSSTVSPQFNSLYSELTTSIPAEYAKVEDFQEVYNTYDVDITATENKSSVFKAVEDIKEAGLRSLLDAIYTGNFTLVYDANALWRSCDALYAIQNAALLLENTVTGLADLLGICKLPSVFAQAKISEMVSELQNALNLRVSQRLDFGKSLDKALEDLNKKYLRFSRYEEELRTIQLFGQCDR